MQGWLMAVPGLYARALAWWRPSDYERRVYAALVRRGDVVIDVGANRGFFTLLFSDLVGARGRVHAFEPVAQNFEALQQNVLGGARYDNVVLNPVACSNRAGGAEMWIPPLDPAQASLTPHHHGSWTRPGAPASQRVETVTLDDYVFRSGLSRIDLLKCDVEGAELPVLKGMAGALARLHPLLVLEAFTPWARDHGYALQDLAGFVRQHGYDRLILVTGTGLTAVEGSLEDVTDPGVSLLCAVTRQHEDRLDALQSLCRP